MRSWRRSASDVQGCGRSGSSPVAGLTASPRRPRARCAAASGTPSESPPRWTWVARPRRAATSSELLDEWVVQNLATWAPASARDQESRVRSIKRDAIASVPLARLSVADLERWHARLRKRGDGRRRHQEPPLGASGPRWPRRSGGVGFRRTWRRCAGSGRPSGRPVRRCRSTRCTPSSPPPARSTRPLRWPSAWPRSPEPGGPSWPRLRWTDVRVGPPHDRLGGRDRAHAGFGSRGTGRRHQDGEPPRAGARRRHAGDDRAATRGAGAARPVDVRCRCRSAQPGPARLVVAPSQSDVGHRSEVAAARSPPLVGHGRHRPGPRRPHGRRPPRPRQPGHDAAGLRPRLRRRPTRRWPRASVRS